MKIAYLGTGRFGLPCLDYLKKSSHDLVHILSSPDKPQGRNLKLTPSPVKEWAKENAVAYTDYQSHDQAYQVLKSLDVDVSVVIAFGKILPTKLIDLPKIMTVNVHSSLLPKYRGAAPIHWALINGDAETGVTVMKMNEKLDAGDILTQRRTRIEPVDDLAGLEKHLSILGSEALSEALDKMRVGTLKPQPQNEKEVTYAKKISKDDGLVRWEMSAQELENRVRAFRDWPVCHTFWNGKRILLLKAVAETGLAKNAAPGEVVAASSTEGLCVTTGKGILRIEELQAEGRKAMNAGDFLKGTPLKAGERLK